MNITMNLMTLKEESKAGYTYEPDFYKALVKKTKDANLPLVIYDKHEIVSLGNVQPKNIDIKTEVAKDVYINEEALDIIGVKNIENYYLAPCGFGEVKHDSGTDTYLIPTESYEFRHFVLLSKNPEVENYGSDLPEEIIVEYDEE